MCGRYQFSEKPSAELAQILRELGQTAFAGDIMPAGFAPILRAEDGRMRPEMCAWGFPVQEKRLVINARAETAAAKPLFRESLRLRRCVIPSTGFYEWDGDRRQFLFRLPGEDTLYMAGIYERRGAETRFCILTTEANDSMRAVHDRMPLVLPRRALARWLADDAAALRMLTETPPALEKTPMDGQLRLW